MATMLKPFLAAIFLAGDAQGGRPLAENRAAGALASPSCNTFSDCTSCASHDTWLPGQSCRWCPKEDGTNCHAEGSVYDTCSSHELITDPKKCPDSPSPPPAPMPPAPTSTLIEKVVAELFKILGISDVDATICVSDVGGAEVFFKDFAAEIAAKNYSTGVSDLARGLSSLSSAVADCKLTEVQAKIDTLAAAVRWANISTAGFDHDVKIVVDASDLWNDIAGLAKAVTSEDPTAIGAAIGQLLGDWTSISGGCGANSTACKFLDGLLRMVQVVATNVAPCEAAIEPAIANLSSGFQLFSQKQYKAAIGAIAGGMDDLAVGLANDACGLTKVASVLSAVAPRLAGAIVKIENSTAVHILVNSADVYHELYMAAKDIETGNAADFGVEMGLLLSKLRSSSCNSSACEVLEGLLSALQIEANDWATCSKDLDAAWTAVPAAIAQFEAKKYTDGLKDLGTAITSLASSVNGCGATQLAQVLEDLATKLGKPALATEIGTVVQVLVEGADLTLDLQKLTNDFKASSWQSVGQDLGTLSSWLQATGCKSFVCKLVEGLLQAAAIPFQNLDACEADLKSTEADFVAGAAALGHRQYSSTVKYWSSALNYVAKATSDCGLASELSFLEQEANLLGFGNVSILGEAAQVIIHGSDFYEELYGAFVAFEQHDYRTAGSDLGKVLDQLSQWTTNHSCTAPVCYVVEGIMQFLGDIQGDIKHCEADLQLSWGNFSAAFSELRSDKLEQLTIKQQYLSNGDFGFTTDPSKIKAGIKDIGEGFKNIASGVSDCHLSELSQVLTALAVKLGIAPEVQWVEEILKILINGVEIENEIGSACVDWSDGNWVGFGYNVIALIKNLL